MLNFEKFNGYWDKGKPYLDGIEFKFIQDPVTQVLSLKAGEAHVMMLARTKDAFELKQVGFKVIDFPMGIKSLVTDAANLESIFADKRVREAIEYAINKKPLVDALGHGFWNEANQYSPTKSNSYIPDFTGRSYNPEKARQLLKEAGYPNGFKTRLICNAFEEEKDTMAAIQRDLRNVGIDVQVEFLTSKYLLYNIKGWKDGIMFVSQRAEISFTSELSRLFKTGAVRFPCLKRTPELDAVFDKAQSVSEFETQKALTQKAARMIYDDAIMTPLWIHSQLTVMYNTVHDTGFGEGNGKTWIPAMAWLSE
jgi:ABC-type transport system substrate-binding protein